MDELLLTPVEAAEALGIGRSKVYELLRSGALTSVRMGSCRRIPADGLVAYLSTLEAAGDRAGLSTTCADTAPLGLNPGEHLVVGG